MTTIDRVKEPEKVVVFLKLPDPTCKTHATTTLNTADGRTDDKTLKRARTALQPESEVSDGSLRELPMKHRTLSSKGAIRLYKKCTGELGHRVTQMLEDSMEEGKSIPCVILLKTISGFFATCTKNYLINVCTRRPAAREGYQ